MARRAAEAPPVTSAPVQGVLDAAARILRPLVRLFIARSIPFPAAAEILRRLYVEVAADEFRVDDRVPTDSRVHLLSGVHRKDVRRLRAAAVAEEQPVPPKKSSLTSLLIARWTTLDELRDADGRPRPLARFGPEDASFEALVRSVSTDIRPRVVLDEWLRLGLVELDDEDRVHLRVEAFVPPAGSDEILEYLGRNSGDHLAAAVHNVLGEGAPYLERSTSYDGLSAESVAELRELASERGMDALRAVNRRAMALQKRDARKGDATSRMAFGAWYFDEAPSPPSPASEEPAKPRPRARRPRA